MHGHPDNVQVLLTDSKANVTTPDGKTAPVSGKAGEVRWRQATQHTVRNTGDKAIEGVKIQRQLGATGCWSLVCLPTASVAVRRQGRTTSSANGRTPAVATWPLEMTMGTIVRLALVS